MSHSIARSSTKISASVTSPSFEPWPISAIRFFVACPCAPPAADIEVPTANPLQPNAETTYVSLVPGIPADANSVFSIRNGYDDVNPEAAKKIHRLSTRVLQLAVVNAVVIVTIRAVYIAFWAMDGRDLLVAEYSVYIFFSLVILLVMVFSVIMIINCNGWVMTKPLGYSMFFLYVLFIHATETLRHFSKIVCRIVQI